MRVDGAGACRLCGLGRGWWLCCLFVAQCYYLYWRSVLGVVCIGSRAGHACVWFAGIGVEWYLGVVCFNEWALALAP